jgi:Flp pilus assembly protein TadB
VIAAVLAVISLKLMWPSALALTAVACVFAVNILCWVSLGSRLAPLREMQKEFTASRVALNRKLGAFSKIMDQLEVILGSLPEDLSEDANRALWNVREELRLAGVGFVDN